MKKLGLGCFWTVCIYLFCVIVFVVIGAIEEIATGEINATIGFVLLLGVGLFIFMIKKLIKKKKVVKNNDKFQYFVEDFEIIVTGIYYKSKVSGVSRQKTIRQLELYEPITFLPEPTNEYDSNAIQVLNEDNIDIGYVKKEEVYLLTKYLTDKYIIDACVEKKYKTDDGYGIIVHVTVREYKDEKK